MSQINGTQVISVAVMTWPLLGQRTGTQSTLPGQGRGGADWGREESEASVCLRHQPAVTQTHCALASRRKKFKHQFYTSGKALQPRGMAQDCAPISEQGAEHGWKWGVSGARWSDTGALVLPSDQLQTA